MTEPAASVTKPKTTRPSTAGTLLRSGARKTHRSTLSRSDGPALVCQGVASTHEVVRPEAARRLRDPRAERRGDAALRRAVARPARPRHPRAHHRVVLGTAPAARARPDSRREARAHAACGRGTGDDSLPHGARRERA